MPERPLTAAQRAQNTKRAQEASEATAAALDRQEAEGDPAAKARDQARARGEQVVDPSEEGKPKRETFPAGLAGHAGYTKAVLDWQRKRTSMTTPRAAAVKKKLDETK